MKRPLTFPRSVLSAALAIVCVCAPRAALAVDFAHDVLPILKKHCAKCHTNDKSEGGLSMNTRELVIESGTVELGNSGESTLIERVLARDPDIQMPPTGKRLTEAEVQALRDWIDASLPWEKGFTFRTFRRAPLAPRVVKLPPTTAAQSHPVDRLLADYFTKNKLSLGPPVEDRTFARRAYLDIVGLLPTVAELESFVADKSPGKRAALVDQLLARKRDYTEHWLTFWSDMLRNAYRGTGYIDGGRKRIDRWLYTALYENKPYDKFVHELVRGAEGSEGFIGGVKWRGNVNESQRREMQAAQNVGQVFMGTNLKCASCHDSFVNSWKLADAYALASVFADKPLKLHRCDKPTGKQATVGFIYPELGAIDPAASRTQKMKQLADLIVQPANGRLTRTIVNRLWAHFMGRGIVEPVDDMDQEPISADLLDWLAVDLAEHNYDLKRTMRLICTSRAYQSRAVGAPRPDEPVRGFRGPLVKRMNAEMFADAISMLTGQWAKKGVAQIPELDDSARSPVGVRAVLLHEDALTRVLGRPNREQVVTRRESVATTLQAIELTNGETLDARLKKGAQRWLQEPAESPDQRIDKIFLAAVGRLPTKAERDIARQLIGDKPQADGVADLLWTLTMLPEFQLIP